MKKTLFMLMSLDGKISSGVGGKRDFDKDLPTIPALNKGIEQYYELEKQTDWYSLITGKVLAKIGWNLPDKTIRRIPARLVVVDNYPHLDVIGINNLLAAFEQLHIVTTSGMHPAYAIDSLRLFVYHYDGGINFRDMFDRLERQGARGLTIQSGGTLNAALLRGNLIDEVSIVVAPVLVGGKNTPSLIDGESLRSMADLIKLRTLELVAMDQLEGSYIHLRYKVLVDT